MQACNHTWRSSSTKLETCNVCGKVKAKNEPMEIHMNAPTRTVKVLKANETPKTQNVVHENKTCAKLSGDESLRVLIADTRRTLQGLLNNLTRALE